MTIEHWEARYAGLGEDKPSWFQAVPDTSLGLIMHYGQPTDRVIDIGGGDSRLVDELVAAGFTDVSVVDISQRALDNARDRVGASAAVNWIVADIRHWRPKSTFDVWHDRAAFHFLTDPSDIEHYWAAVYDAVPVNGHVIIATFADDGPQTCSGLPVHRYDEASMTTMLGEGLQVMQQFREVHTTPWDSPQSFLWTLARRVT